MNYQKRIEKVQHLLSKEKVDLFYIEDETTLLYLTGLVLENAKMVISLQGAALFVDGRFTAYAKEKSPCDFFSLSDENLLSFFRKEKGKKCGVDENISFSSYLKLKDLLEKNRLAEVTAITNPTLSLRMVKDKEEIQRIKQACSITWSCFEHLCSFIKEGMTEKEVVLEFEIELRKKGATSSSFDPIVAFTENAAYPHHIPGDRKCKKDDVVLIDMGVVVEHYRSDMTRIFFKGNPPDEVQKIYDIVRKAHDKALSLCKPGVKLGELDKAARSVISEAGYGKYFPHSLGHGIGLLTHESPKVKEDGPDKDLILRPNMVFTIEPGIYLPGVGGIRYEDIVVITPESYENLYTQ